jgi:succinate dehydrogenase / fumarate reductase cytochrome b subunit
MAGNSFYYRKIHSLLGVIPIGAFLLEHFLTNWKSTKGNEAFIDGVMWLHNIPFLLLIEIFFIWLPLVYHGIYGLYRVFISKNNVGRYHYGRNYMFMLQRVTGVITFVFIVWHTWETRWQVGLGKVEVTDLGVLMHEIFSNPVFFVLYVIGIVAASFHLCNGMWAFLINWGITIGPRAQRISSYVWTVAFFLVAGLGIWAMTGFISDDFFSKGVAALG